MTIPLNCVFPVAVTDAMLVSTDVPEADHLAYNPDTTYTLGQRVILAATHRIYESKQSGNLGHDPSVSPELWINVGPTNRWALFDGSNSTQTAKPTAMSYRLRPAGAINTLALLNLTGVSTIRVRLTHPTYGVLFDQTSDQASLPAQAGMWEWFFGERKAPALGLFTDLPGIIGCDLVVDLTGTTEPAVGVMLFGQNKAVGEGVQQGVRVGIQDYSRKETNAFGDVVLVQRAFAKRASFNLVLAADLVDETIDYLATLRATPCLWIGSARYASTVIYGFYKEFDVKIAYKNFSECSLQIEGLT